MLMCHCWPFSVNCFVYVSIDESMKLRPLLIQQALGEQNDGSECALVSVATASLALSKSFQTCAATKPTSRPKITPSGDSIPGENALNVRARSPTREPNHHQIDADSDDVGSSKDNQGHPRYWKIEQPVAHDLDPVEC